MLRVGRISAATSHDEHINHRVKHLDWHDLKEHVLSLTKKVETILIEVCFANMFSSNFLCYIFFCAPAPIAIFCFSAAAGWLCAMPSTSVPTIAMIVPQVMLQTLIETAP